MQHNFQIKGLSEKEVTESRKLFGTNTDDEKTNSSLEVIKDIVFEPMFILLVAAAAIYFILDETREGFFMIFALLIVSAISFFQDRRSRIALESLKRVSAIKTKILRAGEVKEFDAEEIVHGDYIIVEEGGLIPADGTIVQSNDFSVNESILTGESFSVTKDARDQENSQVFQGTFCVSGLALVQVTAIGKATRFAKIGKSILEIREEDTPLQRQIGHFVKRMAVAGGLVFVAIWGFSFYQSGDFLQSLVKGLTLAMSILPEEIPVAFTTFMALGAWRLMKEGIVVKKIKTVETLGAADVICVDKTGTITEQKMALAEVFIPDLGFVENPGDRQDPRLLKLVETAMWASEPVPFDPMEKSLHSSYGQLSPVDERPGSHLAHEYPLSGKPPIMTHVFTVGQRRIIAAKGSPERIVNQSLLSAEEKSQLHEAWRRMASKGLRVLGVGETTWSGDYPPDQEEFLFNFVGFVGFYDPAKTNIPMVFDAFYKAGINVKIITGDSRETTQYLANQIGMRGRGELITGEELMLVPPGELQSVVVKKNIFTRMFPEAKLRIINALKEANRVVAMTGDGVNDGPALKAAHIGIAMGRQGSEIAKQASALILIEGDLSKMVEAIAMGRKIYVNLKRAIQYIISIHIPIVLMVSLPIFLGLLYPYIFTPVHVIFLEVIMGPTCSIVYENEPPDSRLMSLPPRKITTSFFEWHELRTSIVQGLAITAFLLGLYLVVVHNGGSETLTRTYVFTTLILANIFLTLVNRSSNESILTSIRKKNKLMSLITTVSLVFAGLILYVPAFQGIFEVQGLTALQLLVCLGTAFASVIWIEGYKYYLRR